MRSAVPAGRDLPSVGDIAGECEFAAFGSRFADLLRNARCHDDELVLTVELEDGTREEETRSQFPLEADLVVLEFFGRHLITADVVAAREVTELITRTRQERGRCRGID